MRFLDVDQKTKINFQLLAYYVYESKSDQIVGGLHMAISMRNIFYVCLLFYFHAIAAAPLTFSFHQSGFDEGAYVKGQFSGEDLDGDGVIYSWGESVSEIYNFSMHFSGNSIVREFKIDAYDTKYLYMAYVLNGQPSWIGDDGLNHYGYGIPESIAYPGGGFEEYPFDFGYWARGYDDWLHSWSSSCVGSPVGFEMSCTNDLALVSKVISDVPVPSAAWLFLSGLTGLCFRKKELKRYQ